MHGEHRSTMAALQEQVAAVQEQAMIAMLQEQSEGFPAWIEALEPDPERRVLLEKRRQLLKELRLLLEKQLGLLRENQALHKQRFAQQQAAAALQAQLRRGE